MKLYSSEDAARYLGVSPQRIRQLAAAGAGTKVGQDWVFTEADLQKMDRRNRKVGRPKK